jgi:hypothetical protein
MSLPETAGATRPSLTQEWLQVLRYWLRSRIGVIALIGLALVVGAAFNWSWLVAVGVVPLLITVLPCAAMCALGLCMNRMIGGSCSTETSPVAVPKPDGRAAPPLNAGESGPVPLLADQSAQPDEPIADSAISVMEPPKPEKRTLIMSKHLKTVAAGVAIAAGLAAAPALYARDNLAMRHDSMMGQGGTRGMMGSVMSDMMIMMGMSGGMGMREHCNAMQGSEGPRPNDQWRTPQPGQRGQRQG